MPTLPRFWAELTTEDFAALDPAHAVALLPLGATEQHGPHLPLGVDRVLVDGMVAAALPHLPPELPLLVLPTQQVGYSVEHAAFPGTLTLSPATTLANWTEIGECVAKAGVRKLLLFNAHGGHVSLMDVAARELRARAGLIVYGCSWWNLPLATDALFSAQEHRFGVHGGEVETSLMLTLAEDSVRMEKARDFSSASQERAAQYPLLGNGRSAKLGWHMQDYNLEGAAGNAAGAAADKGRAVLAAVGEQLAALVQEISRLPLSIVVQRPAP